MSAITSKRPGQRLPPVLAPELAATFFDQEARRIAGMPGEAFLAQWDAGEHRESVDTPAGRELSYLILLIPLGRQLAR